MKKKNAVRMEWETVDNFEAFCETLKKKGIEEATPEIERAARLNELNRLKRQAIGTYPAYSIFKDRIKQLEGASK